MHFLFKGVNKYFHMVCIWEKFRTAIHKDVSLKTIWDRSRGSGTYLSFKVLIMNV